MLLGLRHSLPVATLATDMSSLRVFTSALALAFGVYALRKERHLRRLAALHRDECSIHLTVADSLCDRARCAPIASCSTSAPQSRSARPASPPTLADVVLGRLRGGAARRTFGRDTARRGVRFRATRRSGSTRPPPTKRCAGDEPVRQGARDGRTVIAVPLEHHTRCVGVLEVISGPAEPYSAHDAELVVGVRPRRGVAGC